MSGEDTQRLDAAGRILAPAPPYRPVAQPLPERLVVGRHGGIQIPRPEIGVGRQHPLLGQTDQLAKFFPDLERKRADAYLGLTGRGVGLDLRARRRFGRNLLRRDMIRLNRSVGIGRGGWRCRRRIVLLLSGLL